MHTDNQKQSVKVEKEIFRTLSLPQKCPFQNPKVKSDAENKRKSRVKCAENRENWEKCIRKPTDPIQ